MGQLFLLIPISICHMSCCLIPAIVKAIELCGLSPVTTKSASGFSIQDVVATETDLTQKLNVNIFVNYNNHIP